MPMLRTGVFRMRPFPGILSGVLAAFTVIAAFACALLVVAPWSAEPARWPEGVTGDAARGPLRLLAPAPAALPGLPSAAVAARVAPVAPAPRARARRAAPRPST